MEYKTELKRKTRADSDRERERKRVVLDEVRSVF